MAVSPTVDKALPTILKLGSALLILIEKVGVSKHCRITESMVFFCTSKAPFYGFSSQGI